MIRTWTISASASYCRCSRECLRQHPAIMAKCGICGIRGYFRLLYLKCQRQFHAKGWEIPQKPQIPHAHAAWPDVAQKSCR